jgi:ABC-type lipoprotein export system ATPase subunit
VSGAVVELRDVFLVHRTNEGDAAALQGTNLELAGGEVLCVLGPSGAGKSTLLRVIAGIQPPSAGSVQVLGWDIGRLAPRARARIRHEQLGFLAQHSEAVLSPDLRAREAVELPLALRGMPKRARRARVAALLEGAGLSERADAFADELSGGERQRFALCASLAHRPALLLADEPTGELDEVSAKAVRALIAELARNDGTSVIVVSHDEATSSIAQRTVRIRDGRVVEDHRGGDSALVVNRGGWVQLPAELLSEAGIRGRARVHLALDGLIVTPAAGAPQPAPQPLASPPPAPPRLNPAEVSLRSITRGYGRGRTARCVLEELTHDFAPGQLTVVTGPSGSGKSTLLRLIAGLDVADSGRLTIDGQALGDRDDEQLAALRRERIGYLAQEPSLVGFLSAVENVALALRIRGWEAADAAARAGLALTGVGLASRARQRVQRLSAGEQQRVALARALASARGLLIVDEPTSRLDEANAGTIGRMLAAACRDEGQTAICATHDPEVISRADATLKLRTAHERDLPRFEG